MSNPYEIAARRFEQISFLIDPTLTPAQRRAVMRERTAGPSRATLFRWLKAYRLRGYVGLLPTTRADHGKIRKAGPVAWIDYAIGLAYEQPDRSISQMETYLRVEFPDYSLSASTLRRRLKAHPAYAGIRKFRSPKASKKLRGRYEADHPHQCWQLDGKGRFPVRFTDGTRSEVVVLSILDDHSRALLAAEVAATETAEVAVRVMIKAALKWGLPDRIQFDRGSAFDGHVFRNGIAALGLHRNFIHAKSPEWDGKIEAYHRSLDLWFVRELKSQEVVDLEHLQEMLEAVLKLVYDQHHHRMIKTTPATKLAGRVSTRRVNRDDLERAFFVETQCESDKKTGEVRLPNGRFVVPSAMYAGRRLTFRYYPGPDGRAVLVAQDGREIELERFVIRPLPTVRQPKDKRGTGQLQKLVDKWRGQERPNAQPGFGVPEVFVMLGKIVARTVPNAEREAQAIVSFYRQHGPILREPFRRACERTKERLGEGRALSVYLDDLARQIESDRRDAASDAAGNSTTAEVE